MSLSKAFAPGTLFRARLSDNSKHYTAVLLKNGKVLEVKNPDTGVKSTFDSVELWQASHPDCLLEFDASKGSGIVIVDSDINGFNYPTDNSRHLSWVKWLYQMVGEAAPQLLKSEEFRTLYNQMVEVCTKHKQELSHWNYRFSGKERYYSANLKGKAHISDKWSGYPGYFYNENYYYSQYLGPGHKRYSKEDYEAARQEIVAVYTKIYDFVHPLISDYMTKKDNILKTQRKISETKASIKRSQKKIENLQQDLEWRKSYMEKELGALAKLEEEFLAFKTAAL
jgi:hypothetical protein